MKNLSSFLFLLVFVFVFSSDTFAQRYKGEGPIVERELDLASIDAISASGSTNVEILYGSSQRIIAKGHGNIIDRLNTDVSGGKWNVKLKKGNYSNYQLSIYIVLPDIESVSISGSSDVKLGGFEELDDLKLSISGSGNIDVIDHCSVQEANLRISGSGDMDAYDLHCDVVDVHIFGSGSLKISAEEEIDGSISGSGSVKYKGRPAIRVNTSGSGSIRSVE